MAEAAGLVLGAVAFAGVFSTCMEMLEYLEHSRNFARDVQITLTKLSFMKQRLQDWGTGLPGTVVDADKTGPTPLKYDSSERQLITESLFGIKAILASTASLCARYGKGVHTPCSNPLHPRQAPNLSGDSHILVGSEGRPTAHNGECISYKKSEGTLRAPACINTLRQKASWALTDRRKLNDLIADLEFLLSNLEKVSKRLKMANRDQIKPRDSSPLPARKTIPEVAARDYTAMSVETKAQYPVIPFLGYIDKNAMPPAQYPGGVSRSTYADPAAEKQYDNSASGRSSIDKNIASENGRQLNNVDPKATGPGIIIQGNMVSGSASQGNGHFDKDAQKAFWGN